jgi:4-hydroxybenzoate polyprenyltransferase
MKRITYWPQFVLGPSPLAAFPFFLPLLLPLPHYPGLAFNWGALLGSSAVLGHCDWLVALPLYAGSVAWTIVYDTIYAHQDKVDDVHAGVKSTALLFGEQTRPILAGFSGAFVSLLALSGYLNGQGPAFYALSVGGAAAHLAWQLRTVDLESRESCWEKFKSAHHTGAIVWSGMAVDYALKVAAISAAV